MDSRLFGGTCALRGCDPKKVRDGQTVRIDTERGELKFMAQSKEDLVGAER